MTFPAGGGFPMGSGGGVVDGYALTIDDGPPVEAIATNASTGAVVVGVQYAAATNLAAAQSGLDVELTWTDPGGSTWQFIERSANGGATWSSIGHAPSVDETYTDTAPAVGSYLYRARTGPNSSPSVPRSAYSNSASVTVEPPSVPILTLNPTAGTTPLPWLISWTAVPGATQYQLLYRQQLTDPPTVVETTSNTSIQTTASEPADGYVSVRVSQPQVGAESNTVFFDFD